MRRPVRMKRIFSIKKTMIIITIAFVSGIPAAYMPESLNAETSHAYHAQVSFISVVCRSSDSSIQAARLIAAYDLAPYCQRIASAFSPGHDSPSNDRFSPHAEISRMENNTLEIQLLWEVCRRVLRESWAVRIRCLRIQWADFFPCPGFSPDSLVQRTRMRVRLLGSRICHKSHAIQLFICTPYFWHAKRPLLLS